MHSIHHPLLGVARLLLLQVLPAAVLLVLRRRRRGQHRLRPAVGGVRALQEHHVHGGGWSGHSMGNP